MITTMEHLRFAPTALAVALLLAFGPVRAEGDETDGSVTVGLGLIDGHRVDRARFGQYNGLRAGGDATVQLGIDYYHHSAGSGITTLILGENLLGDARELGLRIKRQGDWKAALDYSELVRYDGLTVNTGLAGAGSAAPQIRAIAAGAGSDAEMHVKRTRLGLAYSTWLTPEIDLEISLKTEDRSGSRLFGIGMTCPSPIAPGCGPSTGTQAGWATLMLPEPISANHTQIEARLIFAGDRLQLSGGYYGSFYNNRHDTLTAGVPGSLNNALGNLLPLSGGLQAMLGQPVALAPDNQAHQVDLAGSYAFARTTHGTFKVSYAQALQHQGFAGAGFGAAPRADLGGRVSTAALHLGLNSRPTPRLTLHGEMRYLHRDDQTPIALYNVEGASTYTNRSLPNDKLRGKLQGAYQFNSALRGTLTADFEHIDRGAFTASSAVSGISALRQRTDERGLRAELRRTMSETFSGAVTVSSSRRDGSNWLRPSSGLGVVEVPDAGAAGSGLGATSIFMPTLADRRRDKIRLYADWQPTEELSLQFIAEDGQDRYRSVSRSGLQNSRETLGSVDWSYALSDKWSLNGYLSQATQVMHQVRPAGAILSFTNRNAGIGFGVTGKPTGKITVGGSIACVDDRSIYDQTLDASASPDSVALLAATGGLPDVIYRQTELRLYSGYEFDKQSSVRLDLLHQRSTLRDWTWGYNGVAYAFSDGTTVWQQPRQSVSVIRVSYTYKWH